MTTPFERNMQLIDEGIKDLEKMMDDYRGRVVYYQQQLFATEEKLAQLKALVKDILDDWVYVAVSPPGIYRTIGKCRELLTAWGDLDDNSKE